MSVQLAIDRGNSYTKLSISENGCLQKTLSLKENELKTALPNFFQHVNPNAIIISDVRDQFPFEHLLSESSAEIIRLTPLLKFGFAIHYQTPNSLGSDRLANISGAMVVMPGKNILVIDFGTCITYSLLVQNAFKGGSIAPGVRMRYLSLHTSTGMLPNIEATDTLPELMGQSTTESIQSGVQHAVVLETDAMIQAYCKQYDELQVIITGGDYSFFENNLKSRIFAHPELTRIGLHEILRINRSKGI